MKLRKLLYYRLRMFGLPGLLRELGPRPSARLFFSTGTVSLRVRGAREPILTRSWTSDVEALWQIFVRGDYDFIELEEPPRLVVDAGANAGYASVRFATRWPEATILAIEPEPSNAELCRRNTRPYRNVHVVEAALWSRPGRLRISNPASGKWSFQVEEAEAGEVEAVTLEQLAGDRRIDLLKVDVEGAEREIFSRPSSLSCVDTVVVETETHTPPTRDLVTAGLNRERRAWELHDEFVVGKPRGSG